MIRIFKITSTSLLFSIFASTVICLATAAQLRAADRVRVGLSALSLANSPLWVAEEKGFFRKYGIDAEIILVGGGASRSVSSLLADDLSLRPPGEGRR